MNYTIYSFWLKFYSIYFGLYYSYIKTQHPSTGLLQTRKAVIVPGILQFQYKCHQ